MNLVNKLKQQKNKRHFIKIASPLLFTFLLGGMPLATAQANPTHLVDALGVPFKAHTSFERKARTAVVKYYAKIKHQYIWFEGDYLSAKAKAMIQRLQKADAWGLGQDQYIPSTILANGIEAVYTPKAKAKADIALTMAALKYMHHAQGGRINPGAISRYMDNDHPRASAQSLLNRLTQSTSPAKTLIAAHPQHPQFKQLQSKLERIIYGTKTEKPTIMIPNGPLLKVNARHPHVTLLRKRLNVPVPMKNGLPLYPDDIYDTRLLEAVQEFQASKGMARDGVVGNGTRSALNGKLRSKKDLKKRLIANMERWRWVPENWGATHIHVNIPEYKVRVKQNGRTLLSERVVVGKRKNPTPVFSDEMETIVLNPYWNVPRSIAVNEVLPSLWRNPNNIYRRGLEVVIDGRKQVATIDPNSIDWTSFDAVTFPYRFRQPPGKKNALGEVKFLFPNSHAVYLHDTPMKKLFNQRSRAYSHGCIRVQNPRKLAGLLLGWQGMSTGAIARQLKSGQNRPISLKRKIPVHITYFTMWSAGDGKFINYSDVYGHDRRVTAALQGRPMPLEPLSEAPQLQASVQKPRPRTRRTRRQKTRPFWGLGPPEATIYTDEDVRYVRKRRKVKKRRHVSKKRRYQPKKRYKKYHKPQQQSPDLLDWLFN